MKGKHKLTMTYTRRALAAYDRSAPKRQAMLDRIGSNKGFRIYEAAERVALTKVQAAFAIDTFDRNSLDNCLRISIDDLRRMAKITE
jgi:hypothetical protein